MIANTVLHSAKLNTLRQIIESLQHRSPNSRRPFAKMNISADLNLKPLPEWSFHIFNGNIDEFWWEDFIDINVVDASSYEFVKNQGIWPLNILYASGNRDSGYRIYGSINSSNFVDRDINGDEDRIELRITTHDTDPSGGATDTIGIPVYFELLYSFDSCFNRQLRHVIKFLMSNALL